MSSEIQIAIEGSRKLAAELEAEAAKVKEVLDQETALLGEIQGLWAGAASDQFSQQYKEWNKEADEEAQALDRLCAAVNEGVDILSGTESHVVGMFG